MAFEKEEIVRGGRQMADHSNITRLPDLLLSPAVVNTPEKNCGMVLTFQEEKTTEMSQQ
jgi:hypothetical protein